MKATRSRTTPFALLGLLSLKPMSGYDLRKEAKASIGHFWSESYGQIYPALRELAARGLARRRTERTAGRPDRQVYEITEPGWEALRRWRAEPPRLPGVRNELLLKLFFGERGSASEYTGWIEGVLARETARRAEYRAIRRQVLREQAGHPSLPYWLLTLSYGEHHAGAMLDWARQTLATLRSLRRARARPARRAPRATR